MNLGGKFQLTLSFLESAEGDHIRSTLLVQHRLTAAGKVNNDSRRNPKQTGPAMKKLSSAATMRNGTCHSYERPSLDWIAPLEIVLARNAAHFLEKLTS